MTEFFQHILNGLGLGAIYALIALGYTMVFGILQLINFAHGDIVMLGAYFGYFVAQSLKLSDHPGFGAVTVALAAGMIGCGIVGFGIERFAYRPLRRAPRINLLITAVGISMLLQYGGQLAFTPDPRAFPELSTWVGVFDWRGLSINRLQIVIFLIGLFLTAALQMIVFRTRAGLAMRAVSHSHDTAALMGVPVDRTVSLTFVLGSMLAGAAGVLVGLQYHKIDPLMGVMFGLKAFVAAVVGGIGNVVGAILGALLLGVAEALVVGYVSSTYRDALAFLILILILVFRPTGLLGQARAEKV